MNRIIILENKANTNTLYIFLNILKCKDMYIYN